MMAEICYVFVPKIFWSGLLSRVGLEAININHHRNDISIVAGLTRHNVEGATEVNGANLAGIKCLNYVTGVLGSEGLLQQSQELKTDVFVDFSHPDVFNEMLELAIRAGKPFVSGTLDLSEQQLSSLRSATKHIPIFRDNFYFKVKKFIDEAVELAKRESGDLVLSECLYEGRAVPSEIVKTLQKRIHEVTGATVGTELSNTYGKSTVSQDWELRVYEPGNLSSTPQKKVKCHIDGFYELAHNALDIAKLMATRPVKNDFYTLDDLWEHLPHESATSCH